MLSCPPENNNNAFFILIFIKIENQNIEDLAIVGYELAANNIEYYRGETGVHGFFDW